MTSSKQIFAVALSTAMLTAGATLWLGGGDAWASPKGSDRGATTNQRTDIVTKPKDVSPKRDFYIVRNSFTVGDRYVDQIMTKSGRAFCNDVDDVPVSGACNGPAEARLVSNNHIDWTDDTHKSGFNCMFSNTSSFAESTVTTEIVCQRF